MEETTNGHSKDLIRQAANHPEREPVNDDWWLQSLFLQAAKYFEAHGLNYMQAEDLALEVCLRWVTQVKRGQTAGFSWLRMVQRNLLIDHLRWRGREQRLLESYAQKSQFSPHLVSANAAVPDQLVDLWKRLSDSDQETLLLHYLEGWPVQDLAQRFGVSEDCARQRLCRARARLQEMHRADASHR